MNNIITFALYNIIILMTVYWLTRFIICAKEGKDPKEILPKFNELFFSKDKEQAKVVQHWENQG